MESATSFLELGISYNSFYIVYLPGKNRKRKVSFKFFSPFGWNIRSTRKFLEEAWSSDVKGNIMFMLYGKIKSLKWKLKKLNRKELCDLSMKVAEVKSSLQQIQRAMLRVGGNEELIQAEKMAVS